MNEDSVLRYHEWLNRNANLVQLLAKNGVTLTAINTPSSLVGTTDEGYLVFAIMQSLDKAPTELDLATYIGLLEGTSVDFDTQKLIDLFLERDTYYIRAEILRTLANTDHIGTFEFLTSVIADPNYGEFSVIAAGYAAQTKNPRLYLPLLRQEFKRFPYNALLSFAKVGEEQDIEFLELHRGKVYELPPEAHKGYLRLLDKTIARLRKKYKKPA